MGTLGNDVLRLDREAQKGIVNAGSGDDVILANPDGGDWIIDAYNASSNPATPAIRESSQDQVIYSGWKTQYGTNIQLDMQFKHIVNSNYSHYLTVEKTLKGAALLGTDIIYDADLIGGSIGSDVLRLTNDDFASAGTHILDTVDLHSSGGMGDTVDFSRVDINLNVTIGVDDKHGELLIGNTAVLLHTLKGVENIIGTQFNDVIRGGTGNNTLVGLGGANVLSGGDGADKFVVGQMGAHDIILDAQFNDSLYLRSATNELIPLNVGFLPYAKIQGDVNVQLSANGPTAFFNPMHVTSPVTFVSDVGAGREPLSDKVGNGIFIKYGLLGSAAAGVNDLKIDIYYLDSEGAVAGTSDVLVKNYLPGTLGLEFRKLVEPNYALADYAHSSSRDMQANIENYENAHLDVLNAAQPFHFADTSLDFWMT